jgi:hypothetical protein
MDENVCINCEYGKIFGGNCEYEQEEKCIYAVARYLTRDERKKIEKKLIMIDYLLEDIIEIDKENALEDLVDKISETLLNMKYEIKYRIIDFEYMKNNNDTKNN